jgi:integrase
MSMSRRSGQIIARGEKKWLVRWSEGNDRSTGKWVVRSKIVHGTKREAEDALASERDRIARGVYVTPSRVTVGEALDRWLAAIESGSKMRARSTLTSYRMIARSRIKPTLGSVPVQALRGPAIESLYGALRERGLAPRTVAYTHAVLRACLRWAEGKGQLISISPMRHVDSPPLGGGSARANGLSAAQVRAFLTTAKADQHFALFALLFGTGMRPGEALALRWADVELERGTVRIERTLSRPGSAYEFRPPKTPRSRREVPLSPMLVRALREHRSAQAARRLGLGSAWDDQDLVFAGPIGGPLDELAIYRRHFRPIAAKAGLAPTTRLYDARHTFASLALTSGVPVHEVSRILGHSTVTLTLNTYSHLLPDRASAATNAVGAAIFSA